MTTAWLDILAALSKGTQLRWWASWPHQTSEISLKCSELSFVHKIWLCLSKPNASVLLPWHKGQLDRTGYQVPKLLMVPFVWMPLQTETVAKSLVLVAWIVPHQIHGQNMQKTGQENCLEKFLGVVSITIIHTCWHIRLLHRLVLFWNLVSRIFTGCFLPFHGVHKWKQFQNHKTYLWVFLFLYLSTAVKLVDLNIIENDCVKK